MIPRPQPAIIPSQSIPQFPGRIRRTTPAPNARAPTSAPVQTVEERNRDAMMRRARAGECDVNMTSYMLGVLAQYPDESAILNPNGTQLRAESSGASFGLEETTVAMTSTDEERLNLLRIIAARSSFGLTLPIGQSAIVDTRIFIDTSVLATAYTGFVNGEIPLQFNMFTGTSGIPAPDRVVKITLSNFYFPHIHVANSTVFDFFYNRIVYVSLRFIPIMQQVQSATPNDMFTFACDVEGIDGQAVYLRPQNPTFSLSRPITMTSDIIIRFSIASPRGLGFVVCPIPPTRIRVTRIAADIVDSTFRLEDGVFIGALAPVGATYTVPVLFQRFTVAPNPLSAIEDDYVNDVGYNAHTFSATPNSFIIPTPVGAAIVADDHSMYIFVPKNCISTTIRLSSLQSSRTNDLLPIHE